MRISDWSSDVCSSDLREVRVKGFDSMLSRTLVAARTKLVRMTLDVANQIRGLMKTFGLIVPRSMGGKFEAHVRSLLVDSAALSRIILPLLEAWRSAEHTSELQSLMRISYAVFCLTKKKTLTTLSLYITNIPH